MNVPERLVDSIKRFVVYTLDTRAESPDEIYSAMDKIYLTAQEEAEGFIRDGAFEQAAKLYLLISKTLIEGTALMKDVEVSQTLISVALSWQSRAEQILSDAVRQFTSKANESQKSENYEESTEYTNKARILEYQIRIQSQEALDKEISDFYESIRSKVEAELKSRRPTAILSEKAGWITKKLPLLKLKRAPIETTLSEKAEKSELPAEELVNPDKIATRNTFKKSSLRKGWYDWSVRLVTDDHTKAQIESVTYTLHPTFPRPVRTIDDPSDGFKLRTSGWGEFQIKADIHLKNGETITKYHWLNLGLGRSRSSS